MVFTNDVVARPDPAPAGLADPLCRRHGAATPMRASFGLSLQSGVNHGLDSSHIVAGFRPRPGAISQGAWGPPPRCTGVQQIADGVKEFFGTITS
jgi:hypothetical protein